MIAATANWLVAFDNVSSVSAATLGRALPAGDRRRLRRPRPLHRRRGVHLRAMRPVILNGIGRLRHPPGPARPCRADRTARPEDALTACRRASFWADFENGTPADLRRPARRFGRGPRNAREDRARAACRGWPTSPAWARPSRRRSAGRRAPSCGPHREQRDSRSRAASRPTRSASVLLELHGETRDGWRLGGGAGASNCTKLSRRATMSVTRRRLARARRRSSARRLKEHAPTPFGRTASRSSGASDGA